MKYRSIRLILILCLILQTFFAGAVVCRAAQDAPRLLWGSSGSLGVGNILDAAKPDDGEQKKATDDKKLAMSYDLLRGTGSPAGYMLRHGNIVGSTVSVNVDGRHLIQNRDYFLDTVSGGLSFGSAIPSGVSISVSYRYKEAGDTSRSLAGLPMLPLLFGGTSTASFLHAYRAADTEGGLPFDTLTFGMKMDFDIGSAGLESLLYVSDPRRGSTTASLFEKQSAASGPAPVSDNIISQKAKVELGGSSRLTIGYQDIGQNFTGFATLREQAALSPGVVSQLEREKGVRRLTAGLEMKASGLMPAGTPWNRLNWTRVYDKTGSMESIQLVYHTPKFGVTGSIRQVAPGFTRLASLSKDELSQIALSTRQQFDPNATVGQVTDADRAAATREAGISRNLLNTYMKFSPKLSGTLSFLTIKDGRGDISKQTLSFASSKWQGWVSQQSISDSFTRLSSLAPVEQGGFGNEHGMGRTSAGLSAKLWNGLSLNSDYSQTGNGAGSVRKAGLGLAGKYINFRMNFQSIDPKFNRIADLADPQKAAMASERGFSKWNMALGGQFSKALKVDSMMMRANNPTDLLSRGSDVLNVLYNPSDKTKIVLQHNESVNRSSSIVLNGVARDIASLEQRFKNNWFISVSRDSNLTQAGGGLLAGTVTQTQHFETDKTSASWITYDERKLQYMTGAFENSQAWNVQARAGKALTLIGTQSSVDRGKDPSESISKMGMKWTATKTLNAGLEMFTRSTNYVGKGSGYLASLGGLVAEQLGPFKNLTVTGEYGSTHMSNSISTYNKSIKLDALWGENVLGVEYSHIRLANGKSPLVRGYRFKSSSDPEKWYHLDLYLKDKDAGLGIIQPLRNINADFRLSPTTQLAYIVNQYKELPNGLVELSVSRSTKLTTKLMNSLNLVLDWRREQNIQAGTNVLKRNIGIQRQAAKGLVLDMYYGLDQAITPTGRVSGNSIRMKIDKQVSVDRFFTFTGEATRWDNSNPAIPCRITVESRLDYRMPLSL